MVDNGDGSCSVHYHPTLKDAQEHAALEEQQGYPVCDAVETQYFEIVDGILKPPGGWTDLAELKEELDL